MGERVAYLKATTFLVVCFVLAYWLISLSLDRVPIDYLGDEAARLLRSYAVSDPASVARVLSSREEWAQIHPPGDEAIRGTLNWLAGPLLHDSDDFIRFHQLVSWACVVGGLAAIADGVRRWWSDSAAVLFLALAVGSSPVIYVAHHVIGEALAMLFVGIATRFALVRSPNDRSWPWVVGGWLALASVVRPEASLVFASLVLIPLYSRRYVAAGVALALAAVAPIINTIAIETSGNPESYVSIRRFPRIAFFDVVTDDRMREIIWGFGIAPWIGLLIVAVATTASYRARDFSLPLLLSLAWCGWAVVFTSQIAVGAIHQQERAFVFPALFGLVAVAALSDHFIPKTGRGQPAIALLGVVVVIAGAVTLEQSTYDRWRDRVPVAAMEVADLVRDQSEAPDAILLDWMWWQEWRVALYASEPGLPGNYCNYSDCSVPETVLVPTDHLSAANADRLAAAALFLRDEQPRYVVVFSDERAQEWERWRANQEPFPSFVRPLFDPGVDGCFTSLSVLGGRTYCPVLENELYVVLKRARR